MVGASVALTYAVLHQTRQRRQDADGRIDALVVESPVKHYLTLGYIAREVRDGVRYIVVGHGENRYLSDRTLLALDYSGALIERREVGIEVTGEALSAGNLAL